MAKRKYLFFDIDGTISVGIPGRQYIPDSTKAALEQLRKAGHFLSIATGRAEAMARDHMHSYLIMGDFNSTWDHARFRELLGTTFVDASEQSGEGFHMTYPSNSLVPSLIEIDHIVYSNNSGITVSSLETIEIPGTDHKALLATLEAN